MASEGYSEAFRQLGYVLENVLSDVSAANEKGVALAVFRKELRWEAKRPVFDTTCVPDWERQRAGLPGNKKRISHIKLAITTFSSQVDLVIVDGKPPSSCTGAEPWQRSGTWKITAFDPDTGHHRIELS